MKTLVIIRHAESSWDCGNMGDFDRPLNEKGVADAGRMGRHLKEKGLMLDGMFSSAANRARSTAAILCREMKIDPTLLREDERLYHADSNHLQSILRELPPEWNTVAIVGHNPTVSECTASLCGASCEAFPTCGVWVLSIPLDSWTRIRPGIASVNDTFSPRTIA
jgi:phosphohistidine phosphatase